MLARLLRVMFWPWKAVLRRKVKTTLADALANTRPGDMPKMKVVGNPPVRLTEEPTPEQVADFVRWRSPTYVGPMSDLVADAAARMLLDTDRPEPFDARRMNHMMITSPSAYLCEREGDWWVFDFSKRHLHPSRKITIRSYRFHAETGEAEIIDHTGRTIRESDALWGSALCHTMCWWCHYIHSGLHNWVHFHLPDCMAEAYTSLASRETVLARLVAPHVRFTARINVAGLWVNQSTDNEPHWYKRLKPWGAARSTAKDFQLGIIENTGSNYADLQGHFERPKQLDTRVPYHAYLTAWYPAIERFVRAIDPHIEADAWEAFVAVLERGFPQIRTIDRVTLLAEFIWQVGVLHITDHMTLYRYMDKHGFHVVPEDIETPFTLDDVGRYDRFRTRGFNQTFVRFNGNPGVDNRLLAVENYRFTEQPLAIAAAQLRADLQAVGRELETRGLLILDTDELLQSVCF
jgi:hypothetical protein